MGRDEAIVPPMKWGAILGCLLVVACGDDDGSVVDDDMGTPPVDMAMPPVDMGPVPLPAIPSRIPEADAAEGRAGCAFGKGAMPWETVGEEHPIGDDIPIDHIIVVIQENRSFDHYFGTMEGVDGFPDDYTNPNSDGDPVAPFHTDEYCIRDVAHSWNAVHTQVGDGSMDGFIATSDPLGERAMGYLDGSDLPFYWDLYSTFAMSDHHFCSVLGPTWVNRYYAMSGTSFGLTGNGAIPEDRIPTDEPHIIMQQLDERRLGWRVYQSDVPFVLGGYGHYAGRRLRSIRPLDDFFDDVAEGNLPHVTFVDPSFFQGVEQSDEHPPANPQFGERFIHSLVTALFESPLWERTAMVVTYDEHGGFFDHVEPPEACPPGDYGPDRSGAFDQYGVRVPLVVVSPYAKAGYVSNQVTDLTSVLRLIQARWLLPAFTGRDANAWPLLDMFDFDAPPFMDPPTLVTPTIDAERNAACHAAFPDSGRF